MNLVYYDPKTGNITGHGFFRGTPGEETQFMKLNSVIEISSGEAVDATKMVVDLSTKRIVSGTPSGLYVLSNGRTTICTGSAPTGAKLAAGSTALPVAGATLTSRSETS